jgi:hypothetical protein
VVTLEVQRSLEDVSSRWWRAGRPARGRQHERWPFRLLGSACVARREIRDQPRDWRILISIILLTLFFPA